MDTFIKYTRSCDLYPVQPTTSSLITLKPSPSCPSKHQLVTKIHCDTCQDPDMLAYIGRFFKGRFYAKDPHGQAALCEVIRTTDRFEFEEIDLEMVTTNKQREGVNGIIRTLCEAGVIEEEVGLTYRGIQVLHSNAFANRVGKRSRKCGFLTRVDASNPPLFLKSVEKVFELCATSKYFGLVQEHCSQICAYQLYLNWKEELKLNKELSESRTSSLFKSIK